MNSKHTIAMVKVAAIALTAAAIAAPARADRRFSASDVQRKALPKGAIVITNNDSRITATQTMGDIRKALVSLRTTPIRHRSFGSAIFNSSAPVPAVLPPHLAAIVADAARTHSVDPRLVAAVVRQESAGRAEAVSPVGAQGLMQLMPATAKFLGVTNSFDARQNVFAGTKYLRMLLDTFQGDLDLALAAYNAGPGAVQKYRGIPPYRETQNYVAKIRRNYEASLR
jgi:soluble lytic murein transglycosylase-like protein